MSFGRRGGPGSSPSTARAGGCRTVAPKRPQHAVETTPFDPLHRVVAETAYLADVEDWHDVGVMQPRCRARFVQEAAPADRIRRCVRAEHLERDRPVQIDVHSFVNDAHPAPAQLAHDSIPGHPAPRLETIFRPGRVADQPAYQRQTIQSRAKIITQLRIAGSELLRIGRRARFGEREEGFNRLAQLLVAFNRVSLVAADHSYSLGG